jgi:hypothetical protein
METVDFLDVNRAAVFVCGVVRRLAGAIDEPAQQRKDFVADRLRVECVAADLPHLEAHRVLAMRGAPQEAARDELLHEAQQRRFRQADGLRDFAQRPPFR